MKFYELDLTQFVPHGIPLNSADHVEYTGYVNEFFLKAVEQIQGQLWQVFVGQLRLDYSRSCAMPNSLEAYQRCTDQQLQDRITGLGFTYYPLNDHYVNAQFAYDLENLQYGTEQWIDGVTKYICNSENVTGTIDYTDQDPYCYRVIIQGDIGSTVNTTAIKGRLVENLAAIGTAHTTMLPPAGGGVDIIDDTAVVSAYVGAAAYADKIWSVGISGAPALPPVTYLVEDLYDERGVTISVASNGSTQKLVWGPGTGESFVWNDNKVYAFRSYTASSGGSTTSPIGIFAPQKLTQSSVSYMVAKNARTTSQQFTNAQLAWCSPDAVGKLPSDVQVVQVAQSQGGTYHYLNAFKFRLGSKDFYYVLSTAREGWVTDVCINDYKLVGFFNTRASGASSTSGAIMRLMHVDGTYIQYDPTKQYTVLSIRTASGNEVSNHAEILAASSIGNLDPNHPNDLCWSQTYGSRITAAIAFKVEDIPPAPSYEDITLYIPGGSSTYYYCQPNITSSYTGAPSSSNLFALYTDSSCTTQATYDSTKRYERGTFVNDVWTPSPYQSLADMPDTTVSSGAASTYIIQKDSNNKANLWFITNLNMGGSYLIFNTNPQPVRFRVYSS